MPGETTGRTRQPTHLPPIAIIGMAGMFPQARNLREYWEHIVAARDCIEDVPASRWDIDAYYDPNPATPDKTYSKRGGFLPEVEFDPLEFGLPPNILEITDASQLLGLVVAKQALADAGYLNASAELRERTGVILGVVGGQKLQSSLSNRLQYPVWEKVLRARGLPDDEIQTICETIRKAYIRWEEDSFPGMLGNVVAGRIANRLDLGGINCVVDAACASSHSALKMSLSELAEGRCDMMITGGVDTDNSILIYLCFSKTPAFTRGLFPRPFDAESDGMAVGEGVGMLVLKRLEDAERDGDRIYAVIRGIGTSSDGRYKSIYAPRSSGQALALRRAYADASFSPATVGLVEAHGTGTVAGDTGEFAALAEVFGEQNPRRQHIALGSVKSQIGHTKATAGAAGLIKAALAVYHKILPPTLHVEQPNPKYQIEQTPFYLNTTTRPWIRNESEAPRRAGVSAFGFGGTNFHVVMEEYESDHHRPYRLHSATRDILLSAATPAELAVRCEEWAAVLQTDQARTQFAELARASVGRAIAPDMARLGFLADTPAEAAELLLAAAAQIRAQLESEHWNHPRGIFFRRRAAPGKVAALFAGQGSQYLDMGRELSLNFPEVRRAFAHLDRLFLLDHRPRLSDVVFPPASFTPDETRARTEALQHTEYAQPAIGALSSGMYELLRRAGFRPDFAAGHSFGELTALWAAGVLDDPGYYTLVRARGKAMAPPADRNGHSDPGTMLAATGDVEQIQHIVASLPNVTLANVNSRDQVVLAGPRAAVAQAQQLLQSRGFATVPLPVSAAFHTPLMSHALQPFAAAVNSVTFHTPQIDVSSNTTGGRYPTDPQAMRRLLSEHLLRPVLFRQQIEQLYASGARVFVEFGPRNVLTNLVKNILGDRAHMAVALNPSRQRDSDRQLREGVVQLRVAGQALGLIDAYQAEELPTEAPKRRAASVMVSGNNYVSEKTRRGFHEALQALQETYAARPVVPVSHAAPVATQPSTEPFELLQTEAPAPERVATIIPVYQPLAESSEDRTMVSPSQAMTPIADEPAVGIARIFHGVEQSIAQFVSLQSETLRAHQQYLSNQAEYARIFLQLMQQQYDLMRSGVLLPEAVTAVMRSIQTFHDHHSETLAAHRQYLKSQIEQAGAFFNFVQQQYVGMMGSLPQLADADATVVAPMQFPPMMAGLPNEAPVVAPESVAAFTPAPAPQPVVAPVPQPVATPALPTVSLPPAPEPVLPDLEWPEDVGAPPAMLYAAAVATPVAPSPAPAVAFTPAPTPVVRPMPTPAPVAAPKAPVLDPAVAQGLIAVVSEKTGYPIETLELGLDLESDLGVDSIKRVEILGALQERIAGLPKLSPEELGELRTLGQIVERLSQATSTSAPVAPVVAFTPALVPAPAPVLTPVVPPVAAPQAPALDPAVAQGLIVVVSEKTGYPIETLELGLDLESDLGVDSIKRVEILGALQERIAGLPKLSPEELGELRTLGQIVERLSQATITSAPVAPAAPVVAFTPIPAPVAAPVAAPKAPALDPAVAQGLIAVVSEKTGYPIETLELGLDLESDLGVDSIKRVEILGALQERIAGLPKLSPEELGELRTLGQIVERLSQATTTSAPAAAVAAPHAPTAPRSAPPTLVNGVARTDVGLRALPAPDYLERRLPDGYVCVLTDDGTGLTPLLARSLSERGWSVVVLRFPQTVVSGRALLPPSIGRVVLQDMNETHLDQTLQSIAESYGPIGAFIHLDPVIAAQNGAADDRQQLVLRHVFLAARTLKASLNEAARLADGCFLTVARLDGEFGTGGGTGAIGGGLFGLTKTLGQEWPNVFCRAVDVSAALDTDAAARQILAELHDPNRRILEVGYGARGRATLVGMER